MIKSIIRLNVYIIDINMTNIIINVKNIELTQYPSAVIIEYLNVI